MKERPILFSAPMVRAILSGQKTQTRRALKYQPIRCTELPVILFPQSRDESITQTGFIWPNAKEQILSRCPYGQPGDRLWVRETWRIGAWDESRGAVAIDYKADGHCRRDWIEIGYGNDGAEFERYWIQSTDDAGKAGFRLDENGEYKWEPGQSPCRWRQSIHMPRWASRILLEVTGVRVERLQDIGQGDACEEGRPAPYEPIGWFQQTWETINGAGSWDANPFVWAIEFKRVMP